jgi:hypothetical protein
VFYYRKQGQNDSDDDLSEEEDDIRPYQTVSLDSGLESDMEVDTVDSQSAEVINSSKLQTESDSDENEAAVLSKKKAKSILKNETTVKAICEKLDKVKMFEEKVTDEDLQEIFTQDYSWFSSSSKT